MGSWAATPTCTPSQRSPRDRSLSRITVGWCDYLQRRSGRLPWWSIKILQLAVPPLNRCVPASSAMLYRRSLDPSRLQLYCLGDSGVRAVPAQRRPCLVPIPEGQAMRVRRHVAQSLYICTAQSPGVQPSQQSELWFALRGFQQTDGRAEPRVSWVAASDEPAGSHNGLRQEVGKTCWFEPQHISPKKHSSPFTPAFHHRCLRAQQL